MTAIVSTVPVLFLTRVCKYKVKQNSVHPPCSIIKTACCHHFIMRLKNLHKSALHLKVRAVCRAELYSAVDFFLSVETVSVSMSGCAVCGGLDSPRPCGGCGLVSYCSTSCQRKDWKEHKTRCRSYKVTSQESEGGRHVLAAR